jgi:uncharacterized protein YcfL
MIARFLPALLLLAACESAPPPQRVDPRLILTPNVAGLSISEPSVATGADGRMRVTVNIFNPGGDFPLRYQTDWLDSSGRPLRTLQSRPAFRSLARATVTTIDSDAPSTAARDFRMTLDVDSP